MPTAVGDLAVWLVSGVTLLFAAVSIMALAVAAVKRLRPSSTPDIGPTATMPVAVAPMSEPQVVGVPRELKDGEHRVAITPDGVHELVRARRAGARRARRRRGLLDHRRRLPRRRRRDRADRRRRRGAAPTWC